jgi:hypothetical protein
MNLSKTASALPAFEFFDLGNTPLGTPSETQEGASHRDESFTGVKQVSAWSYCGPLLHAKSLSEMPSTFQRWQDESIDGDLLPGLLPFLNHANAFLHLNSLQHYWITVRATKPDDEFAKPRWHTDDLFYERYLNGSNGERSLRGPSRHLWPVPVLVPEWSSASHSQPTDWKLIATLSGPSTLFIAPAHQKRAREFQRRAKIKCGKEHVCDSIRCVGCSTAASHVRETMDLQLRHMPRSRPRVGQPVFLRVGHERGAVHSEPDLSGGDRVFVNVVPGTEEELRGLMAKWGMEFPRQWAVLEGVIS